MSFFEQHVGHVVVTGLDDEPLDVPDVAVSGMNLFAPKHLDLARRNRLGSSDARRTSQNAASRPEKGSAHDPSILRGVKLLQFRSTATQHDTVAPRIRYQVERNEQAHARALARPRDG